MNMQSDQVNELISALSKAQGEMKPAIKDSLNPHFKSRFADLASVWEACREPLSKHGLAVIQTMAHQDNGSICLVTTLGHSSGQWIKSIYPMACKDSNNPQAWGSSITYARRYTLSSIVGIAPDDDDDGQKASTAHVRKEEKPRTLDKSQWTEFNQLLDQCDTEFQKKMRDYLESQGIKSLADMEEKLFEKLRKSCVANIATQNQAIHAVG
jgi:hypothetical protein